ncbi:MAG: toll/interleukin-1 receptor domain-containing protein [Chitinophagaceae bacterium]|nr:toll/interleukin-1 receptor domain-containing protein [Anaerolineae bacterium]
MAEEYYDSEEEIEEIEGYCMRCRETVEILDPLPVWTRKGMPAVRGDCPICSGTVFRMGKTVLHEKSERPAAIEVTGSAGRKHAKLERDTVYVAYSPEDESIAQQLAADLNNAGIAAWLHEEDNHNVAWAGGVHPALKECARLVFVLSSGALHGDDIEAAWRFFKEKRKPIIIAQVASVEPPDPIRRSPRFDLTHDYKTAFRQMIQALSE